MFQMKYIQQSLDQIHLINEKNIRERRMFFLSIKQFMNLEINCLSFQINKDYSLTFYYNNFHR